jgi:LacI family transcriptional regulator
MAKTIKDIAARAGVSTSTVSRVLNAKAKKYRIGQDTEKRILQVAKEMKYRPNHLARSLRLKKTHTVGLIVPDIANPFFAYVTRMIQKSAYELGYSLIVCNTDENLDTEIEQIDLLQSKGVDGFIIMPVGVQFDHLQQLLNEKIPLVLLDRCFDELNTHSVLVDNYMGACKAVEYLIHCGHQRIAIIQGLTNTYTNSARVKGYRESLVKSHIAINQDYIVGNDFRKENGYIETKCLLNLENRPTALFTTSDMITLGALQAMLEEKVRIPEDVSIVSFDDVDFAPYLVAPLTAVSQPKELMGEIAVKLLIDDIKSKSQNDKKRIILEPKLIIRKSVSVRQ